MNVKTTIGLAFLLVVSVFGLYVVRSRPVEPASAESPPMQSSETARDLIENDLGQVAEIVVSRKDADEDWVFQRVKTDAGATGEWRMTAPLEAKAVRWEVEKIAQQLTGLQYEISYAAGEAGGVSPVEAGLDPPVASVTLTDDEGKSATVELGKPASASTTYVRLAGTDRVCVGKSDLRTLLKSRAIEYRENQPWTFKPDDATRLEIAARADGEVSEYVFVPVGGEWHMESPASAQATAKVGEAVRELSRLRITNWVDNDADKLAVYGLESPAVSLRVIVQETTTPEPASESPEADEADEESVEPEPVVETFEHRLIVSDRAPIGEETKVYVAVGDPPVVGTITKAVADKLTPVMNEWRDMSLTTADVTTATRIEVSVEDDAFVLARREGVWFIGDERADESAVRALLDAIEALDAAAFVDEPVDVSETGLDEPRASLVLTLPDQSDPITLRIGKPTDAVTRRLTYARIGASDPIAKVRSSDVAALLEDSMGYRDRTVLNLPVASVNRLELRIKAPFSEEPIEFTLGRSDETWSMIEPVAAPVRADAVTALVRSLANFRAESVVGLAGQESAFGLHDPAVRVTVVTGDDEVQRHTLLATEHEGAAYAQVENQGAIFKVSGSILTQVRAEFRTDAVLSFDAAEVSSFSVSDAGLTHTFERTDDGWRYAAEPDLPLNGKKVEDLLLRIRDLKTERFVLYGSVSDAARYGLDQPNQSIAINFKDGTTQTLIVSGQGGGAGAPPGRLASVDGEPGVFVLSNEMLSRVTVSLDELE